MTTRISAPVTVDPRRSPQLGFARNTMIALDQAGGCTVRVIIMKPAPSPVAAPMAHRFGPNKARQPNAINDHRQAPHDDRTRLRQRSIGQGER